MSSYSVIVSSCMFTFFHGTMAVGEARSHSKVAWLLHGCIIVEACFVSSSSSMFEFLPSSHYTDVLWASSEQGGR
jgi:hypothetical protein